MTSAVCIMFKGYRPTDGRWKNTGADLMAFTRDHRDLP